MALVVQPTNPVETVPSFVADTDVFFDHPDGRVVLIARAGITVTPTMLREAGLPSSLFSTPEGISQLIAAAEGGVISLADVAPAENAPPEEDRPANAEDTAAAASGADDDGDEGDDEPDGEAKRSTVRTAKTRQPRR